MIPQPLFDRPLQRDPLWWFGIVGGLSCSLFVKLPTDLEPAELAWQIFTGVVSFTWLTAGLILSTVRFHYRRRRAARRTEERPEAPASSPEQPSATGP